MRNRWIVMFLVLSLAMNTAVLAAVGYNFYRNCRQPSTTDGHSHDREHHFYEVLGLSPTQLEKMAPMADAFHRRLKKFHSAMEHKKDVMLNLLGEEGVNQTRIETLRKEMATIQDNVEKTVIAHVLDVKKILDDSQRKQFFDLLRKSMHYESGMYIRAGE